MLVNVTHAAAAREEPAASESAISKGNPITETVTTEQALVAAVEGNRRVEVQDRRTESSTTYANPDGTLTTEEASGPIRMIRDGQWVSVNTDFAFDPDGTVVTKAHPESLKLAGVGGAKATSALAAADAPASAARDLITLGSGAEQVKVQWKGGLPKPVLDGHRATYPEVVPGADLVVDATRTGFEQYLVLNSKPVDGIAPMTLPLQVKELTVEPQEDGSVAFKSKRTGKTVATMPAPVMWDATVDERSGEHTNRQRVPMEVTQQGDTVELRLTPDAGFLADPRTQYPVTIDPATSTLAVLFDTFVQGGETADQSASTDLKLGWPGDYSGSTKRTARSFLTWNTEQFADALVSDAKLKLYNYHSWSCEARAWEVWATDRGATTATRWTSQPTWQQKLATSNETKSGSCNNAGYVNMNVTELAKIWASAKAKEGHMGLRATDESDTFAWKRFYSSEYTEDDMIPTLEVTYNYRPKNGANLQAGLPYITDGGVYKVNSVTPTLRFTPQDTNEDEKIQGTFEVKDQATGQVVVQFTSDWVESGATASAQVPAGKLQNGKTYTFRTTTYDGTHWANGWSAPVTFTVNTDWQFSPAEQSLGAVNNALEAADLSAATTSSNQYAAIASTPDTDVTIPWTSDNDISVTPKDGRSAVTLDLSDGQPRGLNINNFVVYSAAGQPVDTVVQPTLDGGSRTLYVIKNVNGQREYRTSLGLPPGATLEENEDGTITAYAGSLSAPNGEVTLLAGTNDRYVTARVGDAGNQQGKAVATAAEPSEKERFTLTRNADNTVSLRSKANGKYLTTENYAGAQAGMLRASGDSIGTNEKYTLHEQPGTGRFALKSLMNGKYVVAESDYTGSDEGLLRARSAGIAAEEIFTIEPLILGTFALPWAKDANGKPVATSYRIDGDSIVQTLKFDANTAFPVVADPFWRSVWKWTRCAAAVAVMFFPAAKVYKAIKALGGARMTAQLLWKARTKGDFIRYSKKIGKNAAVQILGIATVQSYCF